MTLLGTIFAILFLLWMFAIHPALGIGVLILVAISAKISPPD